MHSESLHHVQPLSGYILPHTQHILLGRLALVGLCSPRCDRGSGAATPEGLHLDNRG